MWVCKTKKEPNQHRNQFSTQCDHQESIFSTKIVAYTEHMSPATHSIWALHNGNCPQALPLLTLELTVT